MKVIMQVTDDSIRYNIEDSITDLEYDGILEFPSEQEKEQFILDCMSEVIENYETSDYYDSVYVPNYNDIVYDSAKWNGYLTEGDE